MKIVFFGSDEFSIKALEACLHSGVEIALVITTPAQKKGRGLKLEPSEVSDYCRLKGIPVAEFPTLRDPAVMKALLTLRPDIFVAASYGKLIPSELLSIPKYRLNVHPSLLPKYRGAAPVNWPILNGEAETGVSIIDIAEKLDAGDIYCQEKLLIGPRMNAEELSAQLAALSYGLLKKVLVQIKDGPLKGVPQDHSQATLARQLEKKDGEISFSMPADEIDRKVRGLAPWPGCYFFFKGERIGLLETGLPEPCHSDPAKAGEESQSQKTGIPACRQAGSIQDALDDVIAAPGIVLPIEKDGGMAVATGKNTLKILRVKPEGKKAMSAADFARGRRIETGMSLSQEKK